MTAWTAQDIPDQSGRTVVVTGANSGIGLAAARELSRAGAHVVLAVRDTDKGRVAAAGMTGNTEVRALDLADLASVRAFAAELEGPVDVLINNAGVMALPERRTKDGFEMQLGTNHLGHFALTGLLLDKITDRVVTVASGAHRTGRIDANDLNWETRHYQRWAAYAQSKLANLLFTFELQRRLEKAGSSVRALAAHPGYTSTDLQSHTGTYQDRIMWLGNLLVGQSAEMGALPTLYAATVADAPGGSYWGPDKFFNMRGYPVPSGSTAASKDEAVAATLWELSEKLTSVSFP